MVVYTEKDRLVIFQDRRTNLYLPIHAIKVSQTVSKTIEKLTPGKAPGSGVAGDYGTQLIDTLKGIVTFEIDGYISAITSEMVSDFPTYFSTTRTARTVKNYFLQNMAETTEIWMIYEQDIHTGVIEKLDITEESTDSSESTTIAGNTYITSPIYSVKIIFVKGTPIVQSI